MAKVVRFGVSIEEDLLEGFDALIEEKGYANRSEAIRNLIRDWLLDTQVDEKPDQEVVGTITMVYDHDHGDLTNRLLDLQHKHHHRIISTLHVHIDVHKCLEVLVVRGRNEEVHRISDFLIGTRGVQHGKLIISAAEPDVESAFDAGAATGVGKSGRQAHSHSH
jgi:CopG family nickel-responsive transcriptional regulator